MLEVKTVSRGNSLALSLPKDDRFKKGQKWLLIPSSSGTAFTLVPKMVNPYTGEPDNEKMHEEWPEITHNEVE